MENTSKFKTDFKYYKQKYPPPDYSNVLDFSEVKDQDAVQRIKLTQLSEIKKLDSDVNFIASLMKPPSEWSTHELLDKPGLIFINNPFTPIGQRYWIYRCLRDYTRRPNRLNIDAHGILDDSQEWWDICQSEGHHDSQALQRKLRWATLGYHHNWDTKIYSENMKDPFPSDLAALSRYVCQSLYNHEEFNAEAAIVNFYHFDSTLSGHTDHSEMDMSAPLLSFSFGQTAIFLLGGTSLDIAPTAMYIKSGDIIIMSKYSRQCYHGVPKIVPAMQSPWDMTLTHPTKCDSEDQHKHSNLVENEHDPGGLRSSSTESTSLTCITDNLLEEKVWAVFQNYIIQSRINMNVRQVLCKGERTLNKDS